MNTNMNPSHISTSLKRRPVDLCLHMPGTFTISSVAMFAIAFLDHEPQLGVGLHDLAPLIALTPFALEHARVGHTPVATAAHRREDAFSYPFLLGLHSAARPSSPRVEVPRHLDFGAMGRVEVASPVRS